MQFRAEPLACGNAVRILIGCPAADAWSVLRRTDDAFTGIGDPNAVVVATRTTDEFVVDTTGLVNGTVYFYRLYGLVSGSWSDITGSVASPFAVPNPSYVGDDVDPQTFMQARLQAAMDVEVSLGNLTPASGRVVVHTAPFAMVEGVTFPTVSVHMDSDAADTRFLGDLPWPFDFDPSSGLAGTVQGWLARVNLNIVAVSLNVDERVALRRAIRRAVLGNMPVFSGAGLLQIDLSQRDSEEFSADNAPIYLTTAAFSCLAPAYVVESSPALPLSPVTAEVFGKDSMNV